MTANGAELRYRAAERQGWKCALCGGEMVDLRACPPLCDNLYNDARHAGPREYMRERMPEMLDTRYNPHAASLLRSTGEIEAAHRSSASSYVQRAAWEAKRHRSNGVRP